MTNKLAVFENNTPSGTKKHRKSTEPESRQTEKMFFFLSSSSSSSSPSSSSDGLVQICITLSQWFCTKQQHFPLSGAPAHQFFPGLKSHEVVRTTH